MYERALAGSEKTLGPEHKSTIQLAHVLRTLRICPRESTVVDEVAGYKADISKSSNPRLAQDETLFSSLIKSPRLMS